MFDEWSLARATAKVAQALAHPTRVQILDLLRDEGAYVMHLTATLGRPQANISQHLMMLREAGLVVPEREGMTVIYRVRDPRVFEVLDHLKVLAASQGDVAMEKHWNRFPGPPRSGRGRARCCRCPRCRRED